MKKIISLLLAVVVMSGLSVSAMEVALPEAQEVVCSYGKITEVDNGYIVVETSENQNVQFNYDENTYLIDAATVAPLSIEDRTTDNVIVYHNTVMTKSIPAQTYAYSIIGNVENDMGNPIYTVVEGVNKTDDGIQITTNNGSLIINVNADAQVSPYLTKNIVKLEDITVNSKVLLWYDVVTMSIPAYASSEKVVILETAYPEEGLVVNGVSIELKEGEEVYAEGDVQMLPLRTVAEALGCTVTWNEEDASILVEKGDVSITVHINETNDVNFRNVLRFKESTYRAVLNGSTTYIEESFFNKF